MPVYEYRCRSCGKRFERLVRRAGAASPPCPDCSSRRVERLLSTFAVARREPAPLGPCGSGQCACRRGT